MTEATVTTICGSMRFFQQMLVVADELTRRGEIVLMPLVRKSDKNNPHTFQQSVSYMIGAPTATNPTPISDSDLDRIHRDKIEMSTSIVVVSDHTGYYGDSTRSEIEYAQSLYAEIRYAHVRRIEYHDVITWTET